MLPLVRSAVGLAAVPVGRALGLIRPVARRAAEADLRHREESVRALCSLALRAMREARDAEAEARRSQEEFLGRMSHELRTPLNAVIGFARVLERNRAGNQRPEDVHMLSRVRTGGESLLHFIETALEQSKARSGPVRDSSAMADSFDVATRHADVSA